MLLVFDTAGVNRTTVAVRSDSGEVLGRSERNSPAERLLPMTDEVLRAAGHTLAGVTALAVGVGPGAYTGLRIGLAHAHALAHALGVPLSGVSSLAAVAACAPPVPRLLVATDARRKEVFSALVVDGVLQPGSVDVCAPADLAARHPGVPVIGDGADMYATVFTDAGCQVLAPVADAAAGLAAAAWAAVSGGGLPPYPAYLREPDAVPAAAAGVPPGAASTIVDPTVSSGVPRAGSEPDEMPAVDPATAFNGEPGLGDSTGRGEGTVRP